MTAKKITRGISKEFADRFITSGLSKFYKKHEDELLLGVRSNYVNLYFNCDSIAKIRYTRVKLTCEIDTYYLDGLHMKGSDKRKNIEPLEVCEHYPAIRANSNRKATEEKKAQSALVLLNNRNNDSKWYCFDVEWVKAFEDKQQKDASKFNGRFDILAISKDRPHRVALIELKYGHGAIGGKSGISKHIEDFRKFKVNGYFDKQEICDTIEGLRMLGMNVPGALKNLQPEEIIGYEFYVITLNNNVNRPNGSTPKQTVSGYLFNDKRWGCKKLSKQSVQDSCGDVTDRTNAIHVNFLFSTQTLGRLTINDIIEHKDYERE